MDKKHTEISYERHLHYVNALIGSLTLRLLQ